MFPLYTVAKVDGEYVQKIQIFYRFIGPLDAIE